MTPEQALNTPIDHLMALSATIEDGNKKDVKQTVEDFNRQLGQDVAGKRTVPRKKETRIKRGKKIAEENMRILQMARGMAGK